MPEMTGERLSSMLSIWMLSAAQGNAEPIDRIETTVQVLKVVGFAPDLIRETISAAASAASLSPQDALDRFAPPAPVERAPRTRGRRATAAASA
jgi:hypothetical protein